MTNPTAKMEKSITEMMNAPFGSKEREALRHKVSRDIKEAGKYLTRQYFGKKLNEKRSKN